MICYTIFETKEVGDLLLIANDTHLIGLYYTDNKLAPKINRDWTEKHTHPVIFQAIAELLEYLKGRRKFFDVQTYSDGTKFQEQVWIQMMQIPYGETISFSELAQKTGMHNSVRATATAVARNHIDIIIPAHRVIAKSGAIGGFAGKWNRKEVLLELESKNKPDPVKLRTGVC
jgi:methylated-DNA-[protein]-cysteine S-methyltransferase